LEKQKNKKYKHKKYKQKQVYISRGKKGGGNPLAGVGTRTTGMSHIKVVTLFFAKKFLTKTDRCAGALS